MKPRTIKEYPLLDLLDRFISDSKRRKRVQKSGKVITAGTIENYKGLRKLLTDFVEKTNFPLRIRPANKLHAREMKTEKNYWKKFYQRFTDYLYSDLDGYDNFVGTQIKLLRSFFNYVNTELLINTGTFHRSFYARSEEIQIVVLTPERLNYLITSKELEEKLSKRLKVVKDIFVFGCTVALRYSDLMKLTRDNLEWINEEVYLNVQSQKTQTYTRVLLPQYAVEITGKYHRNKKQRRLLPYFHKVYMNKYIKELLEIAGFTEQFMRIRQKRGQNFTVYKNRETKEHYRFCDMCTTHTMRRTAITTMLSLGMKEDMVRKISGHAPNSKEFYRYVNYAQAYLDREIKNVHEKLSRKNLVEA